LGEILSANLRTVLVRTETGEIMKTDVGAAGAWIYNKTCYIGPVNGHPSILSVSPDRWFAPEIEKLELKPPQ
jgi:hypothetical protein